MKLVQISKNNDKTSMPISIVMVRNPRKLVGLEMESLMIGVKDEERGRVWVIGLGAGIGVGVLEGAGALLGGRR